MIRAFVWLVIRLRWLVVAGWIAAAVASPLFLPGLGATEEASLGGLVPSDAEALRTERRAFEHFRVPLLARAAVVQRNPEGLSLSEQRRVVRRAARINRREDPQLGTIVFALPVLNTGRVVPGSRESGTTAVTYLFFEEDATLAARATLAGTYAARIRAEGDDVVGATGTAPARWQQWEAIEDALPWVEFATVLFIAIVVGATFRAPGAPLVALSAAGIAYSVSLGIIGEAGQQLDLAVPREVEPVMVVLLLGVVTDYAVFFLSGTRRLLENGERRVAAAERAAQSVTPIVLTSGLIVVFGTAALLVGELEFFRAFGPGAALAVLVALAVSLTFVPALLAITGSLTFRPALRRNGAEDSGRRSIAARLTDAAMLRPVALLVGAGAVAALALTALQLRDTRLGFTLLTGLPRGSTIEEAAFEAGKGFEPGIVSPTMVLVEADGIGERRRELVALERLLERQPGVAGVIGPREQPPGLGVEALLADDAARYALVLGSDPFGGAALDHVAELRQRLPELLRRSGIEDARAGVAGDTALAAETVDRIVEDIARISLAALLVNFLFLALFLRALVAPLYLLAASALGLTAALGATAFVFGDILGYGDLTYYVPFAAAVLLLSLGSDYNLFVVGRIWQQAERRPLREAIVVAAPRASAAITIAGIALAGSFALLALVPLRAFREFAFVMSVGIVIDALIVRTLLVPALIRLFGEGSWWPRRRAVVEAPEQA